MKANAQLPEAKKALERTVQGSKPSTGLLLDLARVSHKQKDPQAALGYLAHARDLNSEDPQIHYLFGGICAELDLSEDAYQSFKKAVQLDGQNADYNLAAGAVALQRRASSESISYLTKYRGQRPKDPRGHLALGAAYYQAGSWARLSRNCVWPVIVPRRPQRPTTILVGLLCKPMISRWQFVSWSQPWRPIRKISTRPRSSL